MGDDDRRRQLDSGQYGGRVSVLPQKFCAMLTVLPVCLMKFRSNSTVEEPGDEEAA